MKKIFRTVLSVFLAILLALSCTAVSFAAVLKRGDVDGNSRINSTDARLVLRASAKLQTLTEEQSAAADADKNGKVNSTDARIILRAAAKIEEIPVEPEFAWVLIETRTEIHEDTDTGIYRTTYSAEEYTLTVKNEYIGDMDKYQFATFTTTCTPPPEIIRKGDKVVMDLTMSMPESNDKDFHWGGYSDVERDRPDMSAGSSYVGKATFEATVEGQPHACSVAAIGDWGHDPTRIESVQVFREFGDPGHENALYIPTDDGKTISQIGIYFEGCGSQIVWVYEWRDIAGMENG